MKAIIMAGGYGTRLQPLTLRTPKCVLPVGDTTIIKDILENLEKVGITDVILSLNKTQEKVKNYLDSNTKFKPKYVFEESKEDSDKLGAIGALQYVVEKYGADDYIVIGADNYTQGLDYEKMIKQHIDTKSNVTLALFELTDITKVSQFGIGVINEKNKITSFQEKPRVEEALSTLASTFIYIIDKEFFKKHLHEYVKNEKKQGRKPDNIGNLWEHFLNKIKIYGYTFSGYWGDAGSPLFYVEINHRALDRIEKKVSSKSKIAENVKISGKVIIDDGCEIEKDSIIIGPCIIKKNTKIEQGTIIGPYTTILQNSTIGKNNIITGSIIFENTKTLDRVKITRAIIDGSSTIEENNRIEEQAMIGYKCKIKTNSQILYNTKLWPFLTVDKNSIINSKVCYEIKQTIHEDEIKKSCYWK